MTNQSMIRACTHACNNQGVQRMHTMYVYMLENKTIDTIVTVVLKHTPI